MKPEELLAHADFLGSLAQNLLFDPNQAQDIAQETWLAALKHPPAGVKNLRAWLAKVARNFSRITYRGESRRRKREQAFALPEGIPSTEEIVEEEEIRGKVVEAVLGLDEPYRSVIVLRYYRDLPNKEVANRLGVPLETMRTRLKKGLALLRSRLDTVYHGDRKKWMLALAPFAGLHLTAPKAAAAAAGASSIFTGALLMSAKLKTAIAAALVLGLALVAVWQVMDKGPDRVNLPTTAAEPEAGTQVNTGNEDESPKEISKIEKETVAPTRTLEEAPSTTAASEITVAGRFLDSAGAPVRDVGVDAGFLGAPFPRASGPDGRFSAILGPDQYKGYIGGRGLHLRLTAYKKGYAAIEKELVAQPGETVHLGDLVLKPGGDISGRVVDREGKPVANARVEVVPPDADDRSEEDLRRTGPFSSGYHHNAHEDGTFIRKGIPSGWVQVWAKDEDTLYSYTDPIELRPGQEISGLELVLDPLPLDNCIGGRVIDPEGNPVPRARIKLSYRRMFFGSGSHSSTTDARGCFRFTLDQLTAHRVQAVDREARFSPAVFENVKPGTNDLVLQLAPLKKLRLAFSTKGGEKLERLTVYAHNNDLDFVRKRIELEAKDLDDKGQAVISVPDAEIELEVRADGFNIVKKGPFNPNRFPDPVEILLVSIPGVRGKVLADGRAASGARISLHEEARKGELRVNGFLSRSEKQASATADADEGGMFNASLQKSGTYYIRAEMDGFAPAEVGPFEINHKKGMEGLELTLAKGGSIQGRIFMPPGRDPAGVIVGLSRGDGFGITRRADADGCFRFDLLTPGNWHVEQREEEISPYGESSSFESSGFFGKAPEIPWVCTVKEGKITIYNLDLTGGVGCMLKGRLTLDGAVPEAWSADLHEDKNTQLMSSSSPPITLDFEGGFILHGKEPGDHILFVSGSPGEGPTLRIRDKVTLRRGENSWNLDLTLGKLTVDGASNVDEPGTVLLYKWKGPGDLVTYTEIKVGTGVQVLKVPAGSGWIIRVRPDMYMQEGFTEHVIREVEVLAGKNGDVSL